MTFIRASQDPKEDTIGTGSTECKVGLKIQLKVGLLRLKTMPKHFLNNTKVRDACKKKAHILSSGDNSQIAAPPFVFKTSKMSDFFSTFYSNFKKKSLIFCFLKIIFI